MPGVSVQSDVTPNGYNYTYVQNLCRLQLPIIACTEEVDYSLTASS